jgi:hypothetical protein
MPTQEPSVTNAKQPVPENAIEAASHMKAIQYRAFGSSEENKFVDLPARIS